MISVKINGQESPIKGAGLPTIADLVELVKNSIDPDHMITSILIDGRDLGDTEWQASTSQFGTAILEVETGEPSQYINARLPMGADILQSIYMAFRGSRKSFQAGDMQQGNLKLGAAVQDLQAFFEWWGTIIELVPQDERSAYSITDEVTALSQTCNQICQQQLYQSWWALGETIEKELEPQLDKMEDAVRMMAART